MTLQFKTGDYVKYRNGKTRGPIEITETGMIKVAGEETLHGPKGHFIYTELEEMSFDIVAVVPAPLPEQFERFVPISSYVSSLQFENLDDAVRNQQGQKIYRCIITPVELMKS